MAGQSGKRDSYLGGAGLLAAAAYLCLTGLTPVEDRLKNKKIKYSVRISGRFLQRFSYFNSRSTRRDTRSASPIFARSGTRKGNTQKARAPSRPMGPTVRL